MKLRPCNNGKVKQLDLYGGSLPLDEAVRYVHSPS